MRKLASAFQHCHATSRGRQRERERRSLADAAFHPNVSKHRASEVTRDGEPQPHARESSRGAALHLKERLEDARELIRGNPDPGIAHGDAYEIPLARFLPRCVRLRRDPDGVADEDQQNCIAFGTVAQRRDRPRPVNASPLRWSRGLTADRSRRSPRAHDSFRSTERGRP